MADTATLVQALLRDFPEMRFTFANIFDSRSSSAIYFGLIEKVPYGAAGDERIVRHIESSSHFCNGAK